MVVGVVLVVREPLLLLVVPVPLTAGIQCKLWLELFSLEDGLSGLLMLAIVLACVVVIVVRLTVVVLRPSLVYYGVVVVVVVPLRAPGHCRVRSSSSRPVDFTDSRISVVQRGRDWDRRLLGVTVLVVDRIEELDCWLLVVPALTRLLARADLTRLVWLKLRLRWVKLLSRNIVGGPRPLTIHQCQ